MNEQILIDAGIDYEGGLRRCAGNAGLYEHLLEMFLGDTSFEEAQQSMADKDYKELFSHVHEIKGMSGNMSITDVYETSSNVVALLRAEDYDAIPQAFDEMKAAYGKAVSAIEKARG